MELRKLSQYKEIECRDRFVLPIEKDIDLFKISINDTYSFLNN